MHKHKRLQFLALNTVIAVAGAMLFFSPPSVRADEIISSCDQKKCDGVAECTEGANMQCFRNAGQTECLTRGC